MSWKAMQLLAVINLAFCLGIVWACICRLNTQLCRKYLSARARYALLLTGALACGFQPVFYGYAPGIGTVLFTGSVLVGMILNLSRWLITNEVPKRRATDV